VRKSRRTASGAPHRLPRRTRLPMVGRTLRPSTPTSETEPPAPFSSRPQGSVRTGRRRGGFGARCRAGQGRAPTPMTSATPSRPSASMPAPGRAMSKTRPDTLTRERCGATAGLGTPRTTADVCVGEASSGA
jgi:hypothetical protein